MAAPSAKWLGEAVYGLPEIYADKIKDARIVANPGCYATSVILALRPLTDAGWVATSSGVVCDCKSGESGAGKELRRDLQSGSGMKISNLQSFSTGTRRKF